MQDLTKHFLELIRLAATDLPPDVEAALRKSVGKEADGSAARGALETILKNVELARQNSTPICQDTGTPIFYVYYPEGWSTRKLRAQIESAVVQATENAYLRPNSVDSLTGVNTGDNLGGDYFPTFHFEEIEGNTLTIDLMLKGGGCENVGAQYALPDNKLGAGRDLAGVRKVALDAVYQAQGKGCAPGILGIAIGGDRGSSYYASKEALFRQMHDENPNPELAKLEDQLTEEANQMGIGPMGFGGETTVLGTKIKSLNRLPASYFVTVTYMCWAYRRRRMTWSEGQVNYQ
ncbi:MAG: fumarate hydratase [Anaerolineales bacterium]|nr:fumarate hydratase [Anaerolineales bacterium]